MKPALNRSIFTGLTRRLFTFAMVQSFFSGATFYVITYINVPETVFKEFAVESLRNNYGSDLSDDKVEWLWTILVASTTAGPLIGSFLLAYLAAKFGRRNVGMIWNNAFLILGCFFQAISVPALSYECLLIGRIISGIVIGLWSIVPVYIAECAPDSCRGLISMTVGIGWTFWLLVGAVLGLPELLGTRERLPFLMAVPAIPAVIQIFLTPLFPKSPKFLYIVLQKKEDAVKAVKYFHGDNADMAKVLGEFEREAHLTKHNRSSTGLLEVLRTRHLRWPYLLCVCSVLAAECGGTDVTGQYSRTLLREFGLGEDSATIGTIVSFLLPFLLSFIAPFVVEYFGRRKIIIFGILSGLFSVSMLFVAGLVPVISVRNGLALCGVLTSFVGVWSGFEAVCASLPGELAPEGIRPVTAASSGFFSWIPAFVILMVFPRVKDAIGSYSYVPFLVGALIFGSFLFLFLPETKGKAVDEIIEQWLDKKDAEIAEMNDKTPLLKKDSSL